MLCDVWKDRRDNVWIKPSLILQLTTRAIQIMPVGFLWSLISNFFSWSRCNIRHGIDRWSLIVGIVHVLFNAIIALWLVYAVLLSPVVSLFSYHYLSYCFACSFLLSLYWSQLLRIMIKIHSSNGWLQRHYYLINNLLYDQAV